MLNLINLTVKYFLQKDRRIDLLRKHIALKKEAAARAAREAEEAEERSESVAPNGTCR